MIVEIFKERIIKRYDSFCNKWPKLGWSVAVVILLIEIVVWALPFFSGTEINASVDVGGETMGGSVIKAGNIENVTINQSNSTTTENVGNEAGNYFNLGGYWRPNEKEAYAVNGKSIMLLPESQRVRFDYVEPVSVMQNFKLTLSLGGINGGNFQFGRFEAWELTVGDGDYRTVTLRDFKGDIVKEENSQRDRPMLKTELEVDGEFDLSVSEKEHDGKLLLTCLINGEEFKFLLDYPAKWQEKDDIYFGVLDYSLGENKTAVYWVYPDITKSINN